MSLLQLTIANQTDTRRLVSRVNDALGQPLNAELLKDSFEIRWPALEKQLQAIRPTTPLTNKRSSEDLVAEILETVRSIDKRVAAPLRYSGPSLIDVAQGLTGVAATTAVGRVEPSSIPLFGTTVDFATDSELSRESGLLVRLASEVEDPTKKKKK